MPDNPVAWVIDGVMEGGERLTQYDDSKVGAECSFDDLVMETIGEPVPLYAAAPEPDWEALAGIVLNDDVYDEYATGGEIRRLAAALKATFGSKP